MPDLYTQMQTTEPIPKPVVGALIKLYGAANKVHLASEYTDAAGLASFIGLSAGAYYLRLQGPSTPYQFWGGATQQVVLSADDVKVTLSMELFSTPVSTHVNYCRCWGYFVALDGTPCANLLLYISSSGEKEAPAGLLYATGTGTRTIGLPASKPLCLLLDDKGYGEMDLPRGTELLVAIPRYRGVPLEITIPDAASANLADLLFPYPAGVKFYSAGSEVNNVLLAQGASITLDVKATLRSGLIPDNTSAFVTFDEQPGLALQHTDGELIITGLVAGVYAITLSAVAGAGYLLPDPAIAVALAIEVA